MILTPDLAKGVFPVRERLGSHICSEATCNTIQRPKKSAKTSFPPHYMIYAPGVTNADIGMNMDAYKKHPSLPLVYAGYSGGARTAYIIVMATQDKGHSH